MSRAPVSGQRGVQAGPESTRRRRLLKAVPLLALPAAQALQPSYALSSPAGAVVTDKSFAVKGDGLTNDRANLQTAIDQSVGKTLLITGNSRIDVSGLTLRSGSRVRFAPGASIKLLPHNEAFYQIFRIWDVEDVVLEGATLDGSKELNAAPKDPHNGGYGMGISIAGSSNITLVSCTTSACWGDGIYIANSYARKEKWCRGITVLDHRANRCRRQGVSIISGANIVLERPVWENIGGTMPSAGLDIEPNSNLDVLDNIRVVNPTTRNCRTGILMYLQALVGPNPKVIQIEITHHRDESAIVAPVNISGLELAGHVVTGRIVIDSPTWVNSRLTAVKSDNYDHARGPEIIVSNQRVVP